MATDVAASPAAAPPNPLALLDQKRRVLTKGVAVRPAPARPPPRAAEGPAGKGILGGSGRGSGLRRGWGGGVLSLTYYP